MTTPCYLVTPLLTVSWQFCNRQRWRAHISLAYDRLPLHSTRGDRFTFWRNSAAVHSVSKMATAETSNNCEFTLCKLYYLIFLFVVIIYYCFGLSVLWLIGLSIDVVGKYRVQLNWHNFFFNLKEGIGNYFVDLNGVYSLLLLWR